MPTHKLTILAEFQWDPEGSADQFDDLHKLIDGLTVKSDAEVVVRTTEQTAATDPPPRRSRGRPKAEAAAGNGKEAPAATAATADDVLLPPGTRAEPQDEGDAEFGLPQASGLTGLEAKEQGIGIARLIYASGDPGKAKIVDMRKQLGVTAFGDLDPVKGHEFLKMAEAAAQQLGVRI